MHFQFSFNGIGRLINLQEHPQTKLQVHIEMGAKAWDWPLLAAWNGGLIIILIWKIRPLPALLRSTTKGCHQDGNNFFHNKVRLCKIAQAANLLPSS